MAFYGSNDFARWCEDFRADCRYFGVPVLLNAEQLHTCYYTFGFSRYSTYDVNSDMANGFTFMEAVMAARGAELPND